MCQCTPSIRTPFCGRGDCQWPDKKKPEGARPASDLFAPPDLKSLALPERCKALAQQIEDFEADPTATNARRSLSLTDIRKALEEAADMLRGV